MPSVKIHKGRLRGRKINIPPPVKGQQAATSSLLKEAIFQIIENEINGSPEQYAFFDLCAGSGQMGLEALSQGFDPVHISELDGGRFSHLLRNLVDYKKELTLHNKDFKRMGSRIPQFKRSVGFLDPPYSFWKEGKCEAIEIFIKNLIRCTAPDIENSESEAPLPFEEIILIIQGPAGFSHMEQLLNEAPHLKQTSTEVRHYSKNFLSTTRLFKPQA